MVLCSLKQTETKRSLYTVQTKQTGAEMAMFLTTTVGLSAMHAFSLIILVQDMTRSGRNCLNPSLVSRRRKQRGTPGTHCLCKYVTSQKSG